MGWRDGNGTAEKVAGTTQVMRKLRFLAAHGQMCRLLKLWVTSRHEARPSNNRQSVGCGRIIDIGFCIGGSTLTIDC